VLSVIGLQDAAKDAIAKELPTCEDLEDLTDMADDKKKIDIHHVMFVFDWFSANIADPNVA
jgi:hypothetical protein